MLTLWRPLLPNGWASESSDVKNYKWRLNPVRHRMLYSHTIGNSGHQRVNIIAYHSLIVSCLTQDPCTNACTVKRFGLNWTKKVQKCKTEIIDICLINKTIWSNPLQAPAVASRNNANHWIPVTGLKNTEPKNNSEIHYDTIRYDRWV